MGKCLRHMTMVQGADDQVQRWLVYEALLTSQVDAEGKGSQRSIGGYHEDSEDASTILRYRLGHCQVSPSSPCNAVADEKGNVS
jgi:hypothetical protein